MTGVQTCALPIWTPELTAAAIAALKGGAAAPEVPRIEHGGATWLDLRGIRIEQTQLDDAIIRQANLRWAHLRDVGLRDTAFTDCNLSHAAFVDCYLRRTRFAGCNIVSARFERCEFSHATIEDSRLDFASFRECEITLQTVRFRDDADPHVQARGVVVEAPDEEAGGVLMHNIIPRLSDTPGKIRTPAARLGEHTREILTRLGVSDEQRAAAPAL